MGIILSWVRFLMRYLILTILLTGVTSCSTTAKRNCEFLRKVAQDEGNVRAFKSWFETKWDDDEGELKQLFGKFNYISYDSNEEFNLVADFEWDTFGIDYPTMRIIRENVQSDLEWVGFGMTRSSVFVKLSENSEHLDSWEFVTDNVYLECDTDS